MGTKLVALGVGIAVLATPIAAQQVQRASAPAAQESELGGQNSLLFFLGIAAVAAGVVLLSEDEDDNPISA